MLHLIFDSSNDVSIFARLSDHDQVLLLNDAVLCALAAGKISNFLVETSGNIHFYVLNEDIASRGITQAQLDTQIKVIDYAEFVRLTVENPLVQSWC